MTVLKQGKFNIFYNVKSEKLCLFLGSEKKQHVEHEKGM
jgi:hypothetical protein